MKNETTETPRPMDSSGEIRCPDDIIKEIADRRFESTFGSEVPSNVKADIREISDQIETPEDFERSAKQAGISDPETVLGFVECPDEPAHIKDGPVPVEIATKIHEDIHRATHPETMREMSVSPEMQGLYEGLTEYLTRKGLDGLHGDVADCCYQSELAEAETLVAEVGDAKLQGYIFRHETAEEIDEAIRRMNDQKRLE